MKSLLLFYAVTISLAVSGKATIFAKANTITSFQFSTQPSFPGGQKAFYKFLGKNLKWPGDTEATGKVIVSFYIEADGRLVNFKIDKGMSREFDSAAIRVLKKSPKWIPAMKDGKAIRIKYSVPINFTLSEKP